MAARRPSRSARCSSGAPPRRARARHRASRSAASGSRVGATPSSGSRPRPPSTCSGARSDAGRRRAEGRPVTRAFVALLLDETTRTAVGAEIERLRPLSRAVAWVPPENLHLTLKFLGQQPDARLDEVRQTLEETAAAVTSFDLTLHGVGAFPGMEHARILWVGVAEGGLPARDLRARVETALEGCGFDREPRQWHPHLTIGRVFDDRRWRREAGPALRGAVADAARRTFGILPVRRVALMRSDLSPRGARYVELESMALRGAA